MVMIWKLIFCTIFAVAAAENIIEFIVDEEEEPGYVIGNLWDTYGPKPDNVAQISATSDVRSLINVDIDSGDVTVKSRIDRDRSDYRDIQFFLPPSLIQVSIRVQDINDNSPEFPQPYIYVEIPESDTAIEHPKSLGTANDPDAAPNNLQAFEIVSGNEDDAFRLHTETLNGVKFANLQTTKPLDHEATSHYLLVVSAYDGGSPARHGNLTVNVTVTDANDNRPLFNQSEYSVQVREDAQMGETVVTVYAEDADSGVNADVTYELRQLQSSEVRDFDIDERTGRVFVNRLLDYETERAYSLIVIARDNGSERQENSAVVTVQVENVNDNAPVIDITFLNTESPGRISEDAQEGSYIAIISVSDADMQLYASFVRSLTFPPNPYQSKDRVYDGNELVGLDTLSDQLVGQLITEPVQFAVTQ